MLWIKRNLFLAVSGGVTIILLAGGAFFIYRGVGRNAELQTQLEEKKTALTRYYGMKPFPAQTNITALKAQAAELKEAASESQKFFAPVPFENVTDLAFKTLLDNSIAELHSRSSAGNVNLPVKDYAFGFRAEKEALTLPAQSFPALPIQLAEVKAICNVLFDARINSLEGIQRPRITGQEPTGASDYHLLRIQTNSAAEMTLTPYWVTFSSFSGNLARILDGFNSSEHGLLVKAVTVETVPMQKKAPVDRTLPVDPRTGLPARAAVMQRQPPPPGTPTRGVRPPAPGPTPGGLETVLDERLLKITLLIEVVRPLS